MRVDAVLFALVLAACGQAEAPSADLPVPAGPQVQADNVVGGDTISGPFEALSNTATSITGDMSFSDTQVSFMDGILLRTTHVQTYSAYDPMAANGDLFDLAAPGDDNRTVDLRRVDAQDITDDERSQGGLCGRGTAPTFIALVHDQPITTLAVIAFTGADEPGRTATNSSLCGVCLCGRSVATKLARFAMEGGRGPVEWGVKTGMRFAAISVLLLALGACGEAAAPNSTAATMDDVARESPLAGDYKPASNTARAITGAMVVQRGGVTFANGVTLYTRTLNPRAGGDLISKNGDSYAAVVGPGTLSVELRRVTEQVTPAGVVGLCGAEPPQYIALTFDERATVVTMLVFSGAEPPGPEAEHSRVCARFGYAAPDGARTREGVVL